MIAQAPFLPRPVRAAERARSGGTFGVAIADGHTRPALEHGSAGCIARSKTPHFFASYAASLFCVETLMGMLAQIGGEASRKGSAEVELCNRRLQEVLDG